MTQNPNELTIENSAVVLIDHQPAVGLAVHSIDQGLLVTNVGALARAAKALGVPTVLSTIGAKGSVLVDPIQGHQRRFPSNHTHRPYNDACLVGPEVPGCC